MAGLSKATTPIFYRSIAIFLMAIHHPIFLHYIPLMEKEISNLQDIFTDIVWYPLYEEIA